MNIHLFKNSIALMLITFFFISCDNFLEGSYLQKEIERISYLSGKERPETTGTLPNYSDNGSFKNAQIVVNFSHEMKFEENFRFTEEEIKSIKTSLYEDIITFSTIKDSNNKIYAYSLNGNTFFKNISIVNKDGLNLADHFNAPVLSQNKKQLTITPLEYNLIDTNIYGNQITVTISVKVEDTADVPLEKSIKWSYTIKDEVDKSKPEFGPVNASLSADKLLEKGGIHFIEGELTTANRKEILGTNHTGTNVYFTINGNDYGGGIVTADVTWVRTTDTLGNTVKEELQNNSFTIEKEENSKKNKETPFEIDLSSDSYKDGLYKVTFTLKDEQNNLSEDTRIFYIIRDTSFAFNSNASTYIPMPELRNKLSDDQKSIVFDDWRNKEVWGEGVYTANTILSQNYTLKFENLFDDIYYTDTKSFYTEEELKQNKNLYKTETRNFIINIYYGLDKNELEETPLVITKRDNINEKGEIYSTDYLLPDEFRTYHKNHYDKNIFIKITFDDTVGNSSYREFFIPKRINLRSSSYDFTNNKIKLTLNDTSSLDYSVLYPLDGVISKLNYRVFYALKDSSKKPEETPLCRLSHSFEEDTWDELADLTEFSAEAGKEYIVCIQSVLRMNNKEDSSWAGNVFGPLTFATVKAEKGNASSENIEKPVFTATRPEKLEKNKGTVDISINISNYNPDLTYLVAWSVGEGNTDYSIFDDIVFDKNGKGSITVPTPLVAPEKQWGEEYRSSDFNFSTISNLKIIAQKGSAFGESEIQSFTFTQDDDNIPPVFSTWTKSHNLIIQPDGNSFTSIFGVFEDKEWQFANDFKLYWSLYNESWGDTLPLFTEAEIETFGKEYGTGYGSIFFQFYNDENNSRKYNQNIQIQTEYWNPGTYMLFGRIEDSHGNYAYGTIGKITINYFTNKIDITYSSENNQDVLTSKLDITGTPDLEINAFTLQCLDLYGTDNSEWYPWIDFVNTDIDNTSVVTEKDKKYLVHKYTGDLTKNTFYRVITKSYDYDELTGIMWHEETGPDSEFTYTGWYAKDYIESDYQTPSVYEKYDSETNETMSYPSYIYLSETPETPVSYETKYFSSNSYGSILWCDMPVLAELYICHEDLGDSIETWERRGSLFETILYNDVNNPSGPTCTDYTLIKLNHLQYLDEPYYYVIVVHFADGTEDMSIVYKS